MDAEITIHVTETERKRIEDFAQEHGVGVDEFVRMVVLNFVTEQVEPGSPDDRVDMLAEFRQSWRDALADNVVPLDEVWKELDDE